MQQLLLEVEVTTPSNKMDLDQDIQVINPKDKNVSPEEKHKWRIPEFSYVPKGNRRITPLSVQELVYGSKKAGVGTSANTLHRENELLSSSKEFLCPKSNRGPYEGLETHFLQRTSPKDKSLVEKPNNFVRGPEGRVGPKEIQQLS
ncbi:hypothetical protein O181_083254 [Austropuccinia psidii MF-1]|uniref:Uncharacterized protein n=1 Tax=Austropuccinia psidii MF-1 TaxID=1389203 RepID=A0A9Q3FQU1_9BASI|nr:hypothetical protein [Austropuccinia psidii MF-1]